MSMFKFCYQLLELEAEALLTELDCVKPRVNNSADNSASDDEADEKIEVFE